jgi:hypothetical protein
LSSSLEPAPSRLAADEIQFRIGKMKILFLSRQTTVALVIWFLLPAMKSLCLLESGIY